MARDLRFDEPGVERIAGPDSVDDGDIKVSDNGKGIILNSSDGTIQSRLYLKNDGTLGLESP